MAPFTSLPQELHDRIFHYLDDDRWYRADLRDLVAMAQTCRTINAAVVPSLYQHIYINWGQSDSKLAQFGIRDTQGSGLKREYQTGREDYRLSNLLTTFETHPEYAKYVDTIYLSGAPCSPEVLPHILARTTRLTQLCLEMYPEQWTSPVSLPPLEQAMLPYKERLTYISIEYAGCITGKGGMEVISSSGWISGRFELLHGFTGLTELQVSLGMLFPHRPTESDSARPPPLAGLLPPSLEVLKINNDWASPPNRLHWSPEGLVSLLRVFLGNNTGGKGDGAWQYATPKLREMVLDREWGLPPWDSHYWSREQQQQILHLCKLEVPSFKLKGSLDFDDP